jgi:5-(carboxyamino)imidazole ribonucleotide mutase
MPASVRLAAPRALPETARTLRRLGLRLSADGILTISPASSHIPRKVGQSDQPGPLLVPDSTSPARTLALLRKLGEGAPGPFFAAGKAGQINAALFAAACLAARDPKLRRALDRFRSRQTSSVPLRP